MEHRNVKTNVLKYILLIIAMLMLFMTLMGRSAYAVVDAQQNVDNPKLHLKPDVVNGINTQLENVMKEGENAVNKQMNVNNVTSGYFANCNGYNKSLYCINKGQKFETYNNFQVVGYIKINVDGTADVRYIKGGTVYKKTVAEITKKPEELNAMKESNKVLAEILSGEYGNGRGYAQTDEKGKIFNNGKDAQQALWLYLGEWYKSVGEKYELDETMFKVSTDTVEFVNECPRAALTVEKAKNAVTERGEMNENVVEIWLLKNTKESADYQHIALVKPSKEKSKKQIIEITKNSSETGKGLPGVEFLIRKGTKYLAQETNTTLKWVDSRAAAKIFTTDKNGQFTIEPGLEVGKYNALEIKNPNPGYEHNIYKVFNFSVDKIDSNIVLQVGPFLNPPYTPPEKPGITTVDGIVVISGNVWENISGGKNETIGSTKDENNKAVQGIKVYWKDSTGKDIGTLDTYLNDNVKKDEYGLFVETDSKGDYSFAVKLELSNHTYSVKNTELEKRINASHVEFKYNGLKYTTVMTNIDKASGSKAFENDVDRKLLDESFTDITNMKINIIL